MFVLEALSLTINGLVVIIIGILIFWVIFTNGPWASTNEDKSVEFPILLIITLNIVIAIGLFYSGGWLISESIQIFQNNLGGAAISCTRLFIYTSDSLYVLNLLHMQQVEDIHISKSHSPSI